MASLVLLFILFKFVSGNESYGSNGILHHLNNGIKFAKDFLGSESITMKVADFVVRAFQTEKPTLNKRRPNQGTFESNEDYSNEKQSYYNIDEAKSPTSPLKHIVKLLGLQPNQITAVAVNALIFVAQMITTFLAGPKHSNKPQRSDDLTSWILNKNSRKLQEIIATAKNDSLPDLIEDLIDEQGNDEETSCIRLLVCKITPFVSKMQEAVFDKDIVRSNEQTRGASIMYQHLPSSEEIHSRGEICEKKHKDCRLYD
ncbi:unnamed protein product [Danaus chrysippus]|uniref:(African queen) hypothetical protein n=1 Tax=Danaus chrysippus TaxID=151541 RepID=A0A8J2R380_9NEOP|nr:unnamed protein product [Danaus chrysippus]